MELIRDALSFAGGMSLGTILGILITCLSFANGDTAIIRGAKCTETEIVGQSPKRYETCVKWEKQP